MADGVQDPESVETPAAAIAAEVPAVTDAPVAAPVVDAAVTDAKEAKPEDKPAGDVTDAAPAVEPAAVEPEVDAAKSVDGVLVAMDKAFAGMATKSYYGGCLEGSFEDTINDLAGSLKTYLKSISFAMPEQSYAYTVGTYATEGIFCVNSYENDEYSSKIYRMPWRMVGDEPTWQGEPIEVVITTTVTISDAKAAKAALVKGFNKHRLSLLKSKAEASGEKAGRALSAKSKEAIQSAHDDMHEVCGMKEGVCRGAKALCTTAKSTLATLLSADQATTTDEGEDEKKSIEAILKLSADAEQDDSSKIAGEASQEAPVKDSRPRTIREAAALLLSLIDAGNADEAAAFGDAIRATANASVVKDEQISDEQISSIVLECIAASSAS